MTRGPSAHFSWREFSVDGRRPLPRRNRSAYARLVRCYLEPLREEFGACTIHSALRSPRHNAEVGGARGSLHLTTGPASVAAADVSCARGRPRDWYEFLDELGVGGLGSYPDHVHVDTRVKRSRW